MTKVLDILKEELEIAMILSGIIQNLHILWIVKCLGLGGWGTSLCMCSSKDYSFCIVLVSNWLWILTVYSSEIVQGVVFFSTNGLELRYVFFLYLMHPLRTQVQVWNKAGKISPFCSWVCNLNGTQQTNVPAVACDVLPSMQTKKIKNIFCSEIQKAEGFQEACQEYH